jgi:phenylacetate-CoA ligase
VLLAGQPGAVPRLTVTTPLPEMVAALNDFRPEALIAYPSVAAALAEEQLQGRLRIAPGGWSAPARRC